MHVKGQTHAVTSPGVYQTAAGGTVYIYVGFTTDGASVPRALWWLYPPFGDDYENAAVLHDYLYRHATQRLESGGFEYYGSDGGHISRAEADALMREVMEVDGFRRTGRAVVYRSVRVGGGGAWRRYRAEEQKPRPVMSDV